MTGPEPGSSPELALLLLREAGTEPGRKVMLWDPGWRRMPREME